MYAGNLQNLVDIQDADNYIFEKGDIVDKDYIDNLFKKYLFNKSVKQIYKPRKIESLYFENNNYEMYNDSLEGLTPRKKIRIRNYPDMEDNKLYLEKKIAFTKFSDSGTFILKWNPTCQFH